MNTVVLVLFFVLLNVFARYLVSVHTYSGYGKAPMYGDYEAQRHWMELSINLPPHEWYFNSSNNNLLYWGLDYPPLTAYHSWLLGNVAHRIEPKSMELFSSRGYETPTSKIFMRMSVIVSDLLTYLPAAFLFIKNHTKYGGWFQIKALLFLCMQPALLLIDHGHFQYNGVSLGLALASFLAIFNSSPVLASVFFCLSLNFKQMGLYYSTTMFFYLLGISIDKKDVKGSICKVSKLGIAVIVTFGVCWFPFLGSSDLAKQVLHRIFPVARGLFEDKVANFWCSVSPLIKFKNIFPPEKLLAISIGCTLLSLLPSGISLLWRPNKQKFIFALISASLGYFLLSFQVHEKSILLPLLPASLLIMSKQYAFFSAWFQLVAIFSMYPLLHKDGLDVPYMVAMVLVTIVAWDTTSYSSGGMNSKSQLWQQAALLVSLSGMCFIHIAELLFTPPSQLPDLFALLFAVFSFLHFFSAWIYTNYVTVTYNASNDASEFKFNKNKLS